MYKPAQHSQLSAMQQLFPQTGQFRQLASLRVFVLPGASFPGLGFVFAQNIQRAAQGFLFVFADMQVDHGGADIRMTGEFLHLADIVACLEEVGGGAVAEGVRGVTFLVMPASRTARRTCG